jgi:hypothetical protein
VTEHPAPGRKTLMVLFAPGGSIGPVSLIRTLRPVADLQFAVPRDLRTAPDVQLLAQLRDPVFFDPDGPGPDASGCDGVVTYVDALVRVAAGTAARHGLPGQPMAAAEALTDKYRQRRVLAEHAVDSVRCAVLRSPADWASAVAEVGLPAVIKPVRGAGSRNVHPVTDHQAGAELVRRVMGPEAGAAAEPEMIIEEFLVGGDQGPHGDYCSVESVVFDGTVTHLAVTSKTRLIEPFRETGQFIPTHLDPARQAQVTALVGQALKAVDCRNAVTHTEVKLTPQGPRIIEVNGRLGGFVHEMVRSAGGPDLVVAAARIALGEQPETSLPARHRLVVQFSHLAPPNATGLLAVEGLEHVRKLAGVLSHRLVVKPGAGLRPGVSTQELDVLMATAPDEDGMYTLLEDVHNTLAFRLRLRADDGGDHEATMSAWELPSAGALPGAGR